MPRALTILLMAALTWSAAAGVASASIQDQIDAATDGDTIHIPAGTYVEHVTIDKDVTLLGDGAATVLQRPLASPEVIEVTANADAAIEALTVSGDPLAPGGVGIVASSVARLRVTAATITALTTGVDVTDASAPVVRLRGNRIAGNTTGVATVSPVDAERTWWGCNAGPGTTGCDTVAGAGAVDADPRLVLGLRSAFSQIQTGGATTELVADLTRDSAGSFAGTAFPDGTPVGFAAALGALAAPAAPTAAGSAATTLTSGDTAGQAAPTATLDGQTVSVPVTFVAPAPVQTVTQTQTVTAPPTTPPPTTTPPDDAKLLADARRAIGSNVVRLEKVLTPGVAFVARSVRTGRGTLTVPDRDVVSLLVLACPAKACDAGVSARVTRTTDSGRPAKPFDLRRATFELAAGRQRVVAVRLTKSRRDAIRAAKRATMTVTIAVSDPAGNRNKTTMRVALKIRR